MYDIYLYKVVFTRISTDVWPPNQVIAEDGCSSPKCFKGDFADMFTALQPILNFTFVVKRTPVAGVPLENGSWTGQIGKQFPIILLVRRN